MKESYLKPNNYNDINKSYSFQKYLESGITSIDIKLVILFYISESIDYDSVK